MTDILNTIFTGIMATATVVTLVWTIVQDRRRAPPPGTGKHRK